MLDWGGSGPDLVFLTGHGVRADNFNALAGHFRSRFRVIAITRRGVAPSSRPTTGYEKDILIADVTRVLDSLKIETAHFVAHSMGGVEMTEIARLYPERVLSLVYLDAVYDHADIFRTAVFDPLYEPEAPETQDGQLIAWLKDHTPDFSVLRSPALAFFAKQSKHPNLPADADAELRQRVQTYWTTEFVPMTKRRIEKFRREVPQGKVVVFENADHFVYRFQEAEVVQHMTEFYDQILK